jgi:hypothetical protein
VRAIVIPHNVSIDMMGRAGYATPLNYICHAYSYLPDKRS